MINVSIDFESVKEIKLSDEVVGKSFLNQFNNILSSIGKRKKKLKSIDMLYDVPSVLLFNNAKDLFCLGYFVPSIIVCRSAAEHLAFEIFFEEVNLQGDVEIIESIAENLDFRKIIDHFLYDKKKNYKLIEEKDASLFHKLYSLGNIWVHPKKIPRGIKIEEEAFKYIEMLGQLLFKYRDVYKDYYIFKGGLLKKATARKKIRPIKLGSER